MPKCPSCLEQIEYLKFSQNFYGEQYGKIYFPLSEADEEITDDEVSDTDNRTYYCPLCDAEIDEEEIIYDDDDDENEENSGTRIARIINGYNHSRFNANIGKNTEMNECPNCHHIYRDELSSEMFCPKCQKTWISQQTLQV